MIELEERQRIALIGLRSEAEQELLEILDWWCLNARSKQGGFHGEVDLLNQPDPTAKRGLVLYARILWTYSAAIRFCPTPENVEMAAEAYAYLIKYFYDAKHGGFYWSLHADGSVAEDHKQLYGQAFALYAFSEYYAATGNKEALDRALELFTLIEAHGADRTHGGYWEACDRNWCRLMNNQLSEKDLAADKSMNTHLHLLEAYTRLSACTENTNVHSALDHLHQLYVDNIIDPSSFSQFLYFSADWSPLSNVRSYGHDVEASWLLFEAVIQFNDAIKMQQMAERSIQMIHAASVALDSDGGLFYEFDPSTGHLNREKHWWPQAEALVGYLNAFQITGDDKYVSNALAVWSYITHQLKHPQGEWVWGRDAEGAVMGNIKTGFWKCPYHNARACLETIHRLNHLLS